MRKTKCHFWVPFHFIQLRFFRGGGGGSEAGAPGHRTHRSDPRSSGLKQRGEKSATPPCVKAARRSLPPSSSKPVTEKKFCVCGYKPAAASRFCGLLNVLAVAPVPPRSLRSVEARRAAGSRARPLRRASWRTHPGISQPASSACCSFICSLSHLFYFWIIFRKPPKTKTKNKKTWRWIFGPSGGGGDKNLVSESLCISNTDDTDRYFSYT